ELLLEGREVPVVAAANHLVSAQLERAHAAQRKCLSRGGHTREISGVRTGHRPLRRSSVRGSKTRSDFYLQVRHTGDEAIAKGDQLFFATVYDSERNVLIDAIVVEYRSDAFHIVARPTLSPLVDGVIQRDHGIPLPDRTPSCLRRGE